MKKTKDTKLMKVMVAQTLFTCAILYHHKTFKVAWLQQLKHPHSTQVLLVVLVRKLSLYRLVSSIISVHISFLQREQQAYFWKKTEFKYFRWDTSSSCEGHGFLCLGLQLLSFCHPPQSQCLRQLWNFLHPWKNGMKKIMGKQLAYLILWEKSLWLVMS